MSPSAKGSRSGLRPHSWPAEPVRIRLGSHLRSGQVRDRGAVDIAQSLAQRSDARRICENRPAFRASESTEPDLLSRGPSALRGRPLELRGGLDRTLPQEREPVPVYAKGPVLAG